MSQGKFSNPRPYRDEEREIEDAFRELTQKNNPSRKYRREPKAQELPLPDAVPAAREASVTEALPISDKKPQTTMPADPHIEAQQAEKPPRQVTDRPAPKRPAPEVNFDLPIFPDEPEEETVSHPSPRPQWLTEVLDFYSHNTKLVLAALCALALMLIVFVITLFVRSAADPYGGKILNNVYIADVNVGGMTKKDAIAAVNEAFGDEYTARDMIIDLSGTQLRITPKDSGAFLDAAAAVDEAYAYGRTGTQAERDAIYKASKKEPHIIAILPYLNLKTANIQKILKNKSGNAGSTLVQTTYGLEGTEPALSAEKFDKNAPCQTLVITMGKPGIGFDPDAVYDQVLDAYSQRIFLVTVENVETLKNPDPIDLEKLYKEFYIAPVNATVNPQTGKTTPGSYGYGFDKEAAQTLLDAAEFGEEIRIPMEYIEPDVLDANSFFQTALGEYQTRCTSNDSRTANLRLACQSIDGTILNPGESLSFQDALGQLTASRGFQSAPEDTGMEETVGGGVAQVSSTLYCAALLSDLTVTARSNLEQMPGYIGSGLDADIGLKLKNGLSYPVRIQAQVSGGYVRISILGTEDRNYYRMLGSEIVNTYKAETEYVDYDYDNDHGYRDGDILQEGRDGYQVKSYTVKYDRTTDKKITSDYVATSNYNAVARKVARVETWEEPTEPETEETTEETTEATEETIPETTQEDSPQWDFDEPVGAQKSLDAA